MPQFIEVRNLWINANEILLVKHTTFSTGADGIKRDFVITLSPNAEPGDSKYRKIWCDGQEIRELLTYFELQRAKILK